MDGLTKKTLQLISPKHGDKFSPNLHKWLKENFREREFETKVFINNDGARFIGFFDDDGWFYGSNLMGVLCNGKKECTGAYQPSSVKDYQEIQGFWDNYAKDGRCAIDPEHEEHFRGNTRWIEHGNVKTCTWCGFVKESKNIA
ncbi:hypothetical protein [Sulfurospirillum multivorans]|uniref:Uncharacterized protein n=2 Tax=Sulfurospirillum multivorans TaxID=66821 RepID=A0AA86E006_SULMK|nr:hypothetical protein [Sulfurospirillum multivorans]AHJ13110.1 hypothetical protein SMUL_1855 [Sulfurospirillum multivorans DSM 12446]QEH06598.1 hypothetical protein SMN_1833 [Sulfurospirillum multivorans]